jgi:hypothetical protein
MGFFLMEDGGPWEEGGWERAIEGIAERGRISQHCSIDFLVPFVPSQVRHFLPSQMHRMMGLLQGVLGRRDL